MTLDEYIEKEFQSNLEIAQEEYIEDEDCDDSRDKVCWNLASEWTQEEVSMYVAKYLDNKWASQQEVSNK